MFHFFRFQRTSLNKKEISKVKSLEKKIKYKFKDPCILKRALCHKSYVNENRLSSLEQYERYEFLGDAVLELVISDLMMEKFPKYSEGKLSRLRSALVNEKSLAELARKLNLGKFLFLGKGEDNCGGRNKDSLLSDVYESVLGAIYLDGGFQIAFNFIANQFKDLLHQATQEDIVQDFKTRLQEKTQEIYKAIPKYTLIDEKGPDHSKTFEVHISIKGEILGKGKGRSKKQAEQNAAKLALKDLSKTK